MTLFVNDENIENIFECLLLSKLNYFICYW